MTSKIFDIGKVDINLIDKNEIFALDTNILYWTHYSQASDPNLRALPYQVTKYPNFISDLLENGNTLVTTVLNISELAHVVENSELRIYNVLNGCKVKKKEFRKMISERLHLKKEMKTIMLQLNETYGNQIRVIEISEESVNQYIDNIDNNACDIFDYIVINKLKKEGIVNFITDDKDFLTINDINLYTTSV
ncbi:PIN domain-containing protein [Anaerosporobacter sp.]|uniref:PIN domain-containing protein n=1 Tax=Anaerosporobacter sp. TaxID=1872529 RepID=UPI00286F6AC5|nr:PIN domain-containing protein [Anaerosporobacter sp.]